MGRDERDELRRELEELLRDPKVFQESSHLTGWMPARVTGILARSVLLLDKSSGRLAIVNIVLTVVILLVGIVQVCLMVRGH